MNSPLRSALAAALTTLGASLIAFAAPPAKPAPPRAPADSSMESTMTMEGDMTMQSMSMSGPSASHPRLTPTNPALPKAQLDFFESKIRPLLIKNCYECHSNQEHKAKAGLTLDSAQGWKVGGKHGPALIPGNPAKSLLLKAVSYSDPDLQMPPDDKLADSDIALLRQWVQMGAPDPRGPGSAPGVGKLTGMTDKARDHWSFKPVHDYPTPTVQNTAWVKTPIDAFVLKKLEQSDMHPSPPAARETLIRRASFDLIGLPPTPEEVYKFVHDDSSDAWEKVIDRLLASPHFGERWGRYWLDTARYSDTSGGDDKRIEYRYPYAWTYRDYVIKAYNQDKPYDEFLKEQLAADLMPGTRSDPSRLAALGFITVGKRFMNPNDTIDEHIDAVGKGMLGLTIACARCHDHKFDPIPQSDYYALHGIFNSTIEPDQKPLIPALAPTTNPAVTAEFQKQLADLTQKSRDSYYQLLQSTSHEFRSKAAAYLMVATMGRKGGPEVIKARNQLIASEHLDRAVFQTAPRYIRQDHGVFSPLFMFAQLPAESFASAAKPLLSDILANNRPRRPINRYVVEAFAANHNPLNSLKDVCDVYGKLFTAVDKQADAYLKACQTSRTTEVTGFDPAMVELFDIPAEIEPAPSLTPTHLAELAPKLPVVNGQGYNKIHLGEINDLLLTSPGSPPRAMIVQDSPHPHNDPVFLRGEANNRGPIAPREFLHILSPNFHPTPFPPNHSGRLELAQDIANRNNPLTARVAVNRIWMHLIGQAFVRTPDDFGNMCEEPSNPQLLDFLASTFMRTNWSTKHLIRMIMLSNTYQQSSETNPDYAQKDPENRLCWRANLRRLDFEAVRDSMLTFTGNIDLTLGGKPVNLTDEPYSYRRSIYGYIDRGNLPELLSQFDFADPDMANSKRVTTIVPQQALFFMNSPMAVDVARKVTSRPEFENAKTDAEKVTALYEVLYQRPPKPEEIALATDFIDQASDDEPATPTHREGATNNRPQRRPAKPVAKKGFRGSRAPIMNQNGTYVARKPLTPWEQYAQALLFTNEIVYEN